MVRSRRLDRDDLQGPLVFDRRQSVQVLRVFEKLPPSVVQRDPGGHGPDIVSLPSVIRRLIKWKRLHCLPPGPANQP